AESADLALTQHLDATLRRSAG
ncbi:MAG: hypothetical protein JWQ48_2512, partial [Conexibacter sp.]|nr:hypothetical protein [Conexibacter sp.]